MDNEIKTEPRFARPTKREYLRAFASLRGVERYVFWMLIAAVIISAIAFVQNVNRLLMVEVPTYGGSFTEGIIGTPRFVNPVLSVSEADRDISMLAYSGLLRKTADGGYIPDLAEKYEVSKDGLTYTFTLRDNIYFHNGTRVTTDDVEFTISKTTDPDIKSPKRPNWEGVSVKKIDDKTISFTLKQPYAQFLENATIGILPKTLWKDIPDEQWNFSSYNLEGIGSGPYKIDSIDKNRAGVPISYTLSSFNKFALGRPFIGSIKFNFYGNEDELISALKNGSIDNLNSIMPEKARSLEKRGAQIKKYPLPRIYGIFFNQGSAQILSDLPVREALSEAIDRTDIVNTVLYGYGTPMYGPIPKRSSQSLSAATEESRDDLVSRSKTILINNGWKTSTTTNILTKKMKKDTLTISFSVSTADKPELKAVAQILKDTWEKVGAQVDIKVFESGDLSQNIIRPRRYDAILFGEIIGENGDPYAFWHSSQRNDPGLNIALYANQKVDKVLEDARGTLDATERAKKYTVFEDYIRQDVPAIFIYSPDFIYALSEQLHGMEIGQLTVPAERFLNIYKWYIDTDWVWRMFAKEKQNI